MPEVTELIRRAERGDSDAADRLFEMMYAELRRLARARLRVGGRDTLLDTSSLVHESYLRFAGAGQLHLHDRGHFMRWAGRVMRSVIVDFARRRQAARRGGGSADVRLATDFGEMSHGASEILRVHDALDEMAALDQRLASIVEMRYFGGMTESEIASAIGLNERTVRRDWEKARLFLRDALGSSSPRTGQS
jgi:RNA polymerase sigma factor (TIGR02999 family)